MKTAVATGDYPLPGETFVNRHIALLFDGQTSVVTGRIRGEDKIGRSVFERRAPLGTLDRVTGPIMLLANRLRHGTSRIPYGRRKAELAAFLRREKTEVILAEFGTQALALAPLANEMGLPIFTYFRGTDASKALQRPHIVKAYGSMFPRLAGVFSVSQFLLDNLAAHGLRHDNAHVIPSGVDVRRFQPGTKRPKSCLAVGRMVQKKAPLITLRSFAEAARDVPEATLTMIGDGPLLSEARALAQSLGVADRVSLPGALPHEEVRAALSEHAIFLQHSVTADDGNTEGLPTAIQEAMSAGCAVVSTEHAGIPEAVVHGITGFLVPEHDAVGYTRFIGEVLHSADLSEMGTKARTIAVDTFDNDVLLAKLEDTIRRTLGKA